MTHADLIARFEAAPEGSRELSDEVARALRWTTSFGSEGSIWWANSGTMTFYRHSAPDFTKSVDAALSAKPAGYHISAAREEGDGWFWAILCTEPHKYQCGRASTAPLALCIAILRALASDSKGEVS